MLDSRNNLRIFDLNSDQVEEQILLDSHERVVSFTFGSKRGWELFSVFCVTDRKQFFAVCPIIPSGCVVTESFLSDLINDCDGDLEVRILKNFLQSIVKKSFEVEDGIRYYELQHRSKDCLFFSDNRLPIILQSPKDANISEIVDMTTLNTNRDFPSSIACCDSFGKTQLFVMADGLKPIWNEDYLVSSPLKGLSKSNIFSPIQIYIKPLDVVNINIEKSFFKPYLISHPLCTHVVYCIHGKGVHEIVFPFVTYLEQLYLNPESKPRDQPSSCCPLFLHPERE